MTTIWKITLRDRPRTKARTTYLAGHTPEEAVATMAAIPEAARDFGAKYASSRESLLRRIDALGIGHARTALVFSPECRRWCRDLVISDGDTHYLPGPCFLRGVGE